MRGLVGRMGVRGGIALGLALLVLGIVAVAKLVGHGAEGPRYAAGPQPTLTVDPTTGDDGEVGATATAYPDDAAARAAAGAFTAAWLLRDLSPAAWHAGIAPLATSSLARSLEGVDPTGVPATRTVGEPVVTLRTDLFAQVTVAVDTGTLLLSLLKQAERWLVDGVDWERA